MMHGSLVSTIMVSLYAGSLFAGPMIEFDTKSFQCGDVAEGKVDTLHAVFHIKNTGDAMLVLKEVRPGCGCTVVKWDSMARPGKTVKIEASVNIKGYHSGAITKYVTVRSNAVNDSMERLSIQATVESIIEVSQTYLTYKRGDAGKEKILTFASKKKDLKVKEVTYEPNKYSLPGTPEQVAEKLKKLKQPVMFTWVKTDSTRADGYRIFHLSLPSPKFDSTRNGEFIVTTNHPDKPEVRISVNLAP
jgi:hypothetical protein